MQVKNDQKAQTMKILVIVLVAITSLAIILNTSGEHGQFPNPFNQGTAKPSADATNTPLLFDGMTFAYHVHYSTPISGETDAMDSVTFLNTTLFNITSSMGGRIVNGNTRVITQNYSTAWVVGSHEWIIIFNNVSISSTVPIAVPLTGDQIFTVNSETELIVLNRSFICWVLQSPQGSIAYYDKYSGMIVQGSFLFTYSSVNYNFTYYMTSTNKPLAPNTNAPRLTAAKVNPTSGNQGTLLNFSVAYTDADNNGPGYIAVVVNGTAYPLGKVVVTDYNYTNGCTFYSRIYLQPGLNLYYFRCHDGLFANQTIVYSNLTISSSNVQAPSLSNPQVSPLNGMNGTTEFTFSVLYTDNDNNVPAYINVTIDGSSHAMVKQDPDDSNFMDGCTYVYATRLYQIKNYSYQFFASDGVNPTSTAAQSNLKVQCLYPLYFDGMEYHWNYYISVGVTLATTDTYHQLPSGLFNVTCTQSFYRYVNATTREIPSVPAGSQVQASSHDWVRVHVPLALNQQLRVCTLMLGDQTFTVTGQGLRNGYDCWTLTTGIGTYYYHKDSGLLIYGSFTFSGYTFSITFTSTNLDMSPNFNVPDLLSPSLSLPSGNENTPFNFSVVYKDLDNNTARNIGVMIDGQLFPMVKIDPLDMNYVDGCQYYVIARLPPGTHNYYFTAFDGRYSNNTNSQSGPIVTRLNSNVPVLSGGAVIPHNAYNDTMRLFNFTVIYTDGDNNFPDYVNVSINGMSYPMQRQNPLEDTFTDGCLYTLSTLLDIGYYSYEFECSDGTTPASTGLYPELIYADCFPTNGLHEFYKFDGNMTDSSGNGNNGYDDGSFGYVPGLIDQAITFDGVSTAYVTTPDQSSISNYTLCALFKAGSFVSNSYLNSPLIDASATSSYRGPGMGVSASTIRISYYNSYVAHNFAFTTGVWYYLAVTFDRQNNRITSYVNGTRVSETAVTFGAETSFNYFYFGREYAHSIMFNGSIDEARIYNRVLTPDEIRWLMNPWNNRNAPSLVSSARPSLGNQSTMFNFTATYTDVDNGGPVRMQVFIDGMPYSMVKVNVSDMTYNDGCAYLCTTFLPIGGHNYSFSCYDGLFTRTTPTYTNISVVSTNVNVPYFTQAMVSPASGSNATVYDFSVIYHDRDNNFPVIINVTINSTTYPMTIVNPLDVSVMDGAVYHTTALLSHGYYQYRIQAFDGAFSNATYWMNGPESNPFYLSLNRTMFFDDFENGASKWASITGLWHLVDSSTSWPNMWVSPSHAMWYGQESGGTYGTGAANNGEIVTVPFNMANAKRAYLGFYHYLDNYGITGDYGYVYIRNGTGGWSLLASYPNYVIPWQRVTYNISAYCGSGYTAVQLRFLFVANGDRDWARGWIIDDVKVYTNEVQSYSLTTPASGSAQWNGAKNFTWTCQEYYWGQVNFTWQVSNSSGFTTIVDQVTGIPRLSQTTMLTRLIDFPTGTYYWRIRPTYGIYFGNWSGVFSFVLTHNDAAPTLSSVLLNPSSGDQWTDFVFSATYTDVDNNAPIYMRVTINGVTYNMVKENASDSDYTNGCVYRFVTRIRTTTNTHTFSCSDGLFSTSDGPNSGPDYTESNDNDPTLSNPAFTPASGYNGTTRFTFTVRYTDADNNSYVQVNVTIDGTVYTMSKQTSSDVNYVDGCIFQVTNIILNGPGTCIYSFTATDGARQASLGPLTGPQTTGPPLVDENFESYAYGTRITDTATWDALSGDGYGSGINYYTVYQNISMELYLVDTNTGAIIDIWYNCTDSPSIPGSFKISFKVCIGSILGPLGNQPMYVNILDNGTERIGISIDQYNARISYHTSGSSYTSFRSITRNVDTIVEIETLSPSTYVLRVNGVASATLTNYAAFTGKITGIEFRSANNPYAPYGYGDNIYMYFDDIDCSWTPNDYAPTLTSDMVNPTSGSQATSFTFSATYTDLDNNAPQQVNVVINGTAHAMTKQVSGDITYTDGCVYRYITFLAVGTYEFFFNCSDGEHTNTTSLHPSLVVEYTNNNSPQVQSPHVTPTIGNNATTFVFEFTYVDADNNLPTITNITINSTAYNMSQVDPLDIIAQDGILFRYSTTLDHAYYRFMIQCFDGERAGSSAWINNPEVTPFYNTNLTLFFDDFESGASKWTMTSLWHITNTTTKPVTWTDTWTWDAEHSPTHSAWFGSETNGQYANNLDGYLTSVPVNLTSFQKAYLEFYTWQYTESSFDFCRVQVSTNGGSTWSSAIYQWSGSTSPWQKYTLNLSQYCGYSSVQVRFWFHSDYSNVYRGWLVDDVKIFGMTSNPWVTLVSPTNSSNQFNGAINFTWNSLDSAIVGSNYTWQLSDSLTFGSILASDMNIPETPGITSFLRTVSLLAGTYYWRVMPMYGIFHGKWSDAFAFTILLNDFAPLLTNYNVSPVIGSNTTTFVFSVTFTDADNNPPTSITVTINGTEYPVVKQVSTDNNYTDGCVYQYSTTLGLGSHEYYFNCSDGTYAASTTVQYGPSVRHPPSATSPPDQLVMENATGVIITWQLTTYSAIGQYRILRNGSQVQPWAAWPGGNNSYTNVTVDTNAGLGIWEYTIQYNDSMGMMGAPDFVVITVNDIPSVTIGNAINNTIIPGNATGYVIPWTFHDLFGGTGNCQLLRNGTGIASSAWTNGLVFNASVSTNIGYHTFNYTMRYTDGLGTAGIESHVFVTIVRAPTSTQPGAFTVAENATGIRITWRLFTPYGSGVYRVLRDGAALPPGWTGWSNDTDINITVNTDIGLGTWDYTIQYNDSNGFFGIPHTVVVSVNDLPEITGAVPINNTAVAANSTVTFTWTIYDEFGGTGTYRILANGVPGSLLAWNNGVPIACTVNTNSGYGVRNYTIVYSDVYGYSGVSNQVLLSVVRPPSSTQPDDIVLLQGSPAVNVTWTLSDVDGSGQYRVLRGATTISDWALWPVGNSVNVTVVGSLAVGIYTYMIEFNNTHGIVASDAVQVTIDDLPVCVMEPADLGNVQTGTNVGLQWRLSDGIGAGRYTVYINGIALASQTNIAWVNNGVFTVAVNTNMAVGTYNYTLVFSDSNGFEGVQSTVLVTIVQGDDLLTTILKFITDYWLYLIIGLAGIVVIASAAAAARKRKKVASAKVPPKKKGKQLPDTAGLAATTKQGKAVTGYKTLPDVRMPQATVPSTPLQAQLVQPPAQVPIQAKFYCARCAKYYDIQNPDMATWYTCPACKDVLTYVVDCPHCSNPIALTKELHDKLKPTGMQCSFCGKTLQF